MVSTIWEYSLYLSDLGVSGISLILCPIRSYNLLQGTGFINYLYFTSVELQVS